MTGTPKYRLLVLDSHPVQYRTPLYRYLAEKPWLDLEVWFGDNYGVVPRKSAWGVEGFMWDGDQLSGYRSRFLRNVSPKPDPSTFLGKINLGLPSGIRALHPDAVLIYGYATLFQWISFWSARRAEVPILFLAETNAAAERAAARRFLKRAVLERLYRRIDAFLVIGTMNGRHYEEHGVPPEKRFFTPYSVDNRYFAERAEEARPDRDEIRRSWGVRPGDDVLLFAGRLVEVKRPKDLIAAAARLEKVHAVFCGSGPMEEALKSLARSVLPGRTSFLGFRNQAQLPPIYAASDLLVLPSSFEPWGLVVNEAIASGTPAAASLAAGCAHDLVPEEWRFAPGDVDGLVRAVRAWRSARNGDLSAVREWLAGRIALHSYETVAEGIRHALEKAAA